ncbi:SPFH domain-containing protein, partial [Stenotrophomonas geniculata]|uniref:SPFH domain-containing protein n=2 Tax=Stenotrophomonas geniculata TaxID=86188 RepID=UPI0039C68160
MKSPIWIAVIVAVVLGLLGSVYVVREDQTAMVLNLGKVVRSDIKPGLHFKVPVVETVKVFDRRFQVLDTAPARYFTAEQKDVSVDFFAIGYISNVGDYFRATGGGPGRAHDARPRSIRAT